MLQTVLSQASNGWPLGEYHGRFHGYWTTNVCMADIVDSMPVTRIEPGGNIMLHGRNRVSSFAELFITDDFSKRQFSGMSRFAIVELEDLKGRYFWYHHTKAAIYGWCGGYELVKSIETTEIPNIDSIVRDLPQDLEELICQFATIRRWEFGAQFRRQFSPCDVRMDDLVRCNAAAGKNHRVSHLYLGQ